MPASPTRFLNAIRVPSGLHEKPATTSESPSSLPPERLAGRPMQEFLPPPGVVEVSVDPASGEHHDAPFAPAGIDPHKLAEQGDEEDRQLGIEEGHHKTFKGPLATAQLVRLAFTFTRAAYLDPRNEDVSLVLENGLVEGRSWLPYRQRREMAEHAYQQTRQHLLGRLAEWSALLAPHGMGLSWQALTEPRSLLSTRWDEAPAPPRHRIHQALEQLNADVQHLQSALQHDALQWVRPNTRKT